jgi:hypothetical protein
VLNTGVDLVERSLVAWVDGTGRLEGVATVGLGFLPDPSDRGSVSRVPWTLRQFDPFRTLSKTSDKRILDGERIKAELSF